uniref:Mitochondrial carrier protein n=1 Tax=Aureoumbra lagunensis TaxID=44058 RepID=A0A7S3K1T9_9STRA
MGKEKRPLHFARTSGGQLMITSGVTLVFEAMMGHQLEFFKIVRQTTMKQYTEIMISIIEKRGIIGLWDGFLPWGALQAVSKGAVFGFSHNILSRLVHKIFPDSINDTIAGAGAGGIQGLVLSPTLLLKTRVMTDPSYVNAANSGSPLWESFKFGFRLVRNEGVGTLMKGAPTFAAKRVGDWGTRYAFTNLIELKVKRWTGRSQNQSLPYSQRIVCSSLGGLASAASTIPLDVLVANIQSASAAGKKVSLLDSFRNSFHSGGFRSVFGFATRGFRARALHVMLTTVVVKTGTQFFQDHFDPPLSS